MDWQGTFGRARGSFLRRSGHELYVKQPTNKDGSPVGLWKAFVDGIAIGEARDQGAAQAEAEATLRRRLVVEAGAASVAAAARERRRPA